MEQTALMIAALAALAVTALSGFLLVPFLKRLKFGQTINEMGPAWHAGKQGTPTMGGFMFALGSCAGLLAACPFLLGAGRGGMEDSIGLLVLGLFTALAFSAVGFVDDYLKVVRKRNLGLTGAQKLVMQGMVAACFLVTLHLMGRLSTLVRLPFLGQVQLGLWFYPLSLLLIVGLNNAVNLTDGIDGLCASVTFWALCGFLVILTALMRWHLAVWCAALAGGCAGFLRWNFYPAKVFMGDTGSLFLGGAVAALGYCMGRPDILVLLGLVYLLEAASVILQRGYFKLTKRFSADHVGRRIFKMSPIHHHFEMSGWSEVKINVVFSLVTVACGAAAFLYAVVWG